MNSTPDPDRDRLDQWLDQALGDLPEREAPDSLLPLVMARVAREEQRKQRSGLMLLRWAVLLFSASSILAALYFSPEIMGLLSRYAPTVQLAAEIESVRAGIQFFATLFDAWGKILGLVPPLALFGITAMVITCSACSFAGMGTAIFRLVHSPAD